KADANFESPSPVSRCDDLHHVPGRGLSAGAAYVITAKDGLMRRLVASDLIEITFPLYSNEAGGLASARAGLVSFRLTFDVRTGALTGGTATVGTPSL